MPALMLWTAFQQTAASLPHLAVHTHTASCCHPLLLDTLQPVQTTGDAICAFNAISLCLTGSEWYALLLRLLTAHAFMKYKPDVLQTLINTWSTSSRGDPIAEGKVLFYEALHKALTNYTCMERGEAHLFSLSCLFNRPIFQYNSFYEHSQLALVDTADPAHLARRFLNFERGTRLHVLYCSSAIDAILQLGDIFALPKHPLAVYHAAYVHWVALIYHSHAVIGQIPIPRFWILRELYGVVNAQYLCV